MRRRALLAVVVAAAAASSCGYALVGRGGGVAPEIKRLGVPPFRDSTGKPGLDEKITQKVMEELLRRGRVDVVPTAEGVDAVVDGELVRYDLTPVGFTTTDAAAAAAATATTQASRYSVTVVARIKYFKTGQEKEPIWSNDSFTFRDEFEIGTDPQAFFDREGQAQDRLATNFARNLVASMLEAF